MTDSLHAFRDDILADHDATALAALIARGDIHPREALAAALARLDQVEPRLNALALDNRENALKEAEKNTFSGFFAGVPSLIKDNTDTAGHPTGHGAAAVHPRPARRTSAFARQYLAQGFNLLGKSRMPEFGFNGSTEFDGADPTRNPWHTAYSSGGSSGGTAALVAAGVVPLAHGNDGGGSIRIPAAACGLVGLKPSRGRLVDGEAARALPINIVSEGVLTRSVRDTANFFHAAEQHYRNRKLPTVGRVQGPGQARLRIGIMPDSITGTRSCPQTRAAVADTATLLESLGHRVAEAQIPLPQRFVDDFLLYWAFLSFMVSRFGRHMLSPDFNAAELDNLSQGLARYFRAHLKSTPAMLWQLRRTQRTYAQAFRHYDAILSPVVAHTTPELGYLSPAQPFETLMERLVAYTSFTPANNAAGSPAISLPLAQTDTGLPIGIMLSGRHGGERQLLELAFELEAARPFRRLGHTQTGQAQF
ncbi:MAG: amidase [Alcanivorax sp.]|nr:amidase [Alcanivorax sp.]